MAAKVSRPFLKNKNAFKKIIIIRDTPRPLYTEEGVLMMSIYSFLFRHDSINY